MARKLGLRDFSPQLGHGFMLLLMDAKADFTLSFRLLSQLPSPVDALMMSDRELVEPLLPALPEHVPTELHTRLAQWVSDLLQCTFHAFDVHGILSSHLPHVPIYTYCHYQNTQQLLGRQGGSSPHRS